MTRSELAAWCVEVTEPPKVEGMARRVDIDLENPPGDPNALEAVRSAYKARQDAENTLRDRTLELAVAIRQARESHSLAEIAQELGVSRQRVHQISDEK